MIAGPARFITRDDNYSQNYGYPYWCAHVLNKLNATYIRSAEDLILAAAEFMNGYNDRAYHRIYTEACKKLELSPEEVRRRTSTRRLVFGSANDPEFGVIGGCLATPLARIKTEQEIAEQSSEGKALGYRRYYEVALRNNPDWFKGDMNRPIEFSYIDPERMTYLSLIKIGRASKLFDSKHLELVLNVKKTWESEFAESANLNLFMKHAVMNELDREKLMKCLHPLYEKVFDRSSSQDLKSDSIITFYWIVAQSTPVVRGGSALAKIVLEYLSAKAEIELPHLKQGTDLWAEAATQTLDSFKQKFKQEAYFDKAATSREILDWHAEKAGAKKAMSR